VLFGNRIREKTKRNKRVKNRDKKASGYNRDECLKKKQEEARKRKNRIIGQATKGIRWMPWCWEPTKDVVSCEKPRGAASRR
jgi:vacuolar-type H+-ATPase subunit H